MKSSITLKSILLDAVTGLLALCLLIAILVVIHGDNDLRMFVIITAVLFLLAGLLRAQSAPVNPWLKGLLVDSGGCVPLMVATVKRVAFTAHPIATMILFVLISLPLAACGVKVRHRWALGFRKLASAQIFVSIAAVILGTVTLMPLLVARLSAHHVNRPAPSFWISTLDGRIVNSSDLKGHVAVLAFWATWCVPCLSEVPQLEDVIALYKNNPRVVFWAVDSSWGGDTVEKARAFSAEKGWNLPLAFDSTGAAQALGVDELPTLVMLDTAGNVRIVHAGYDASEHLATSISLNIESLLRQKS